jgi:hypothetical protein
MDVPLLGGGPVHWSCPNCWVNVWLPLPPPGQAKFHVCPGLHGLTAPLIRDGDRVRVTAEERQEYLGREVQATGDDDGKPYMAVRTEHDDGHTDLAVNAGLAQARIGDYR